MHPYIAYIILSNPSNHHPRPDECCAPVRMILRQAFGRLFGRRR